MTRRSEYQLLKPGDLDNHRERSNAKPNRRRARVGWIFLAFLSTIITIFYYFQSHDITTRLPEAPLRNIPSSNISTSSPLYADLKLEQCKSSLPPPAKPPAPVNLWTPLTVAEISHIRAWLEHPDRKLNLTRVSQFYPFSSSSQILSSTNSTAIPSLAHNNIFLIESYPPPKAEALAYLDSEDPYKATPPKRYARVTIHHGAEHPNPMIRDYLVGPIPYIRDGEVRNGGAGNRKEDEEEMTLSHLKDIYHLENGTIPWNARGFLNAVDFNVLWRQTQTPGLVEALEDLFNVSLSSNSTSSKPTLTAGASGPFSFTGSFRRTWLSFRRDLPGAWLHPLNFFQYVDMSGTDPSKWYIRKIVYNWQMFGSVEEFVGAWRDGTLIRTSLPSSPSSSTSSTNWTTRDRLLSNGHPRDLDHLPGPRSVSFAGLRFRVDFATQYISWMSWGFYLSFDRDMGLSLWDVRFVNPNSTTSTRGPKAGGGKRIIYQLTPTEALAQYSGNDPMQTTTAWLDRYFGMGTAVRNLIPYYDCPAEAVFLPATSMTPTGTVKRDRAVCVFESEGGGARPITRHTGWLKGEFGATKGYVLIVRSVSTVGNYDYIFDYTFHLDGTIEVRVSASGYLQGGYWEPKQEGYGGRIRDTTMGNLHDHVINFKVDLDISGTSNSLLETTTAQETVIPPWFDPLEGEEGEEDEWGNEVIQQKITKRIISNESEALLEYPRNFQGGYAIVNQDEKNRWGYPRGYAVHPGYSPVHNTVIGSKRLLHNANWARYNLAVSKRKETEPSSSSMWNMNLPGNPPVDFHKFFDGENITQEDLVVWVNVGTHHLPQAEDSPNTKANVATSSFMLTPLNYFDSDISMESSNAILIDPTTSLPSSSGLGSGSVYAHDDYGVKQDFSCVPEPLKPFEYSDIRMFDLDGREVGVRNENSGGGETGDDDWSKEGVTVKGMRRIAELFHRIDYEF
ncbi:amine oxidase catalytic domain-containing protein [Dendrothele bispora CBS 962.96]|uniref:Amine oxidase n=1 Tax=Dendrothele bispora (strain CBS 962.96) TaxID=1314807 RepID=A0A4S8LNW2_DENBC|nr:amine oxidase catalytic domain-containing protein [Dendrothele bispora CBS 962.96]